MKTALFSSLMLGTMCFLGAKADDFVTINKIMYGVNTSSSPEYAYVYQADNDIVNASIPDAVESNGNRYPVTSINNYAFSNCLNLQTVEVGRNIVALSYGAFQFCSALKRVYIAGDNLLEINGKALFGCSSLTDINIPNSVYTIDFSAFNNCSSLTSLTLPSSLETIGNYAFRGCSSLTGIVLPGMVREVGDCAFLSCSSLQSLTVSDSSEPFTVGSMWIYGCPIQKVYYGRGAVQEDMFEDDTELAELILSRNVTKIDAQAFVTCTAIGTIVSLNPEAPAVTTSKDKPQFAQGVRDNALVTVPDGALAEYRAADGWKEFARINQLGDAGLDVVYADPTSTLHTVYSLGGRVVMSHADPASIATLPPGLYLLDNRKILKR